MEGKTGNGREGLCVRLTEFQVPLEHPARNNQEKSSWKHRGKMEAGVGCQPLEALLAILELNVNTEVEVSEESQGQTLGGDNAI